MPRALLHPGRVIAKDFAKYALPVVCNECLWSLAFSLYTVIMGHMADNAPILSAYTIAGNLQRMITPASFAAGGAAAVLIGREIGRGNRDQVRARPGCSTLWRSSSASCAWASSRSCATCCCGRTSCR